jgi:uncharacterized protein YfiM (DUF2279 family)
LQAFATITGLLTPSMKKQSALSPVLCLQFSARFQTICTFIVACLCSFSGMAQQQVSAANDSIFWNPSVDTSLLQSLPKSDSLDTATIKRRIRTIAATNVLLYSTGMVGLYQVWYRDFPQSKFHFFNDIKEWKQMDKIGHVYSAYAESKASMELWRWTGISRKKRIWLGGLSGAMYQTAIEILDGFSTEWGWSWGDFAANVSGSGLLIAQELAWDEQRIQMKWSFHRKNYEDVSLNNRSDDLFGKTHAERFLKDYNGQTYWLSTTLKPFFPQSNLPAWLQVSVGTGVEGLFGGFNNIATDKNGQVIFDRSDIKRSRQWYLAPDVDLTKIKTNKKGIKVALQILNIIKFPTPSLQLQQGKLSWNWLHF